MRVSLESIRRGDAGLDEHRAAMLRRVPAIGDWAKFSYEHLSMKDLAYLTAKTGHEFAILRGKHIDILFHGSERSCTFDEALAALTMLGFAKPQSQKVLTKLFVDDPSLKVEKAIKKALTML